MGAARALTEERHRRRPRWPAVFSQVAACDAMLGDSVVGAARARRKSALFRQLLLLSAPSWLVARRGLWRQLRWWCLWCWATLLWAQPRARRKSALFRQLLLREPRAGRRLEGVSGDSCGGGALVGSVALLSSRRGSVRQLLLEAPSCGRGVSGDSCGGGRAGA